MYIEVRKNNFPAQFNSYNIYSIRATDSPPPTCRPFWHDDDGIYIMIRNAYPHFSTTPHLMTDTTHMY